MTRRWPNSTGSALIENALYRHVFAARAGMLRNYDPLVARYQCTA